MDIFAEVSIIERILAFMVYIGAFAAIPLLAKAFAGALNQFSGMINDRSKGLLDRGRNKMKEHAEKGYKHARERRGEKGSEKTQEGSKRLNWKRFLAGGSLRDKAVGKGSKRKIPGAKGKGRVARSLQRGLNRRQFADERYAAEQDKQHQEVVGRAQYDMGGEQSDYYEAVAKDPKEALYRRQAALAHLAQRVAIPHLRRVMAYALETGDADPNVHLALFNTKRSGALSEEKIVKAAPDLAVMDFEHSEPEKGKIRVQIKETSDNARLVTIGEKTRGKDLNELDISTLRIGLGLNADKDDTVIDLPAVPTEIHATGDADNLRRIMVRQIESIMDPKNLPGQGSITAEQLALFEHVMKNRKKFLDDGSAAKEWWPF